MDPLNFYFISIIARVLLLAFGFGHKAQKNREVAPMCIAHRDAYENPPHRRASRDANDKEEALDAAESADDGDAAADGHAPQMRLRLFARSGL